jgi:hypothetical protein
MWREEMKKILVTMWLGNGVDGKVLATTSNPPTGSLNVSRHFGISCCWRPTALSLRHNDSNCMVEEAVLEPIWKWCAPARNQNLAVLHIIIVLVVAVVVVIVKTITPAFILQK